MDYEILRNLLPPRLVFTLFPIFPGVKICQLGLNKAFLPSNPREQLLRDPESWDERREGQAQLTPTFIRAPRPRNRSNFLREGHGDFGGGGVH